MRKEYELISTQEHLIRMQEQCDPKLINAVFDITEVYETKFSKFWNASSFILDNTAIRKVDKIQVVTLFMITGGIVEFDGHQYNLIQQYDFWRYLLEHHYISTEEYDTLCNMGRDGQITFIHL